MPRQLKGMDLLRSLGDFSDPVGPAARVQTDALMQEMRELALNNPEATYRISEDGPEQTITEILAELDAEDAAIEAMRAALELDPKKDS